MLSTRSARQPWRRRALLVWVLLILLGASWWYWFAPTSAGGRATYVLVYGTSMEPGLHQGDLVVARQQSQYSVGDVAVVAADRDMFVIHRLMARQADGWLTKGDNHARNDPWLAPDASIRGTLWLRIPQAAVALAWWQENPYGAAALVSALVLASYLPWRRRRLATSLRDTLTTAQRESRRDGRSNAEYGVLWLAAAATAATGLMLTRASLAGTLLTTPGLCFSIAFAAMAGLSLYFVYRLYDGRGVAEPSRSMYALAGRLYLVERFPELDDVPQEVGSAVALRTIAEKYRLPVLHRIDPETGGHEFLLITVQKGSFRWAPSTQPASARAPLLGRFRVPPTTGRHLLHYAPDERE